MGGTRTVPPTGTRRPAVNRDQMARKVVAALGIVLVAQALFALCLVSAQQTLVPRNMPFGVTGSP